MTRVLITGGAGFLGRHLCRLCAEAGDVVTATYRSQVPDDWHGAQPVQVDLMDQERTAALVREGRPELVYHLAGQSSTSVSWRAPVETYGDNVLAQVSLLEACVALEAKPRILVTSSSDVYGAVGASENPVVESLPVAPLSPYAGSKLGQEVVAGQYARAHGLDIVIVRPFLQIGPGRSDQFFSGSFARQVAEIKLGIKSEAIRVGNVDVVRDMTDVRDVASACMLLLNGNAPAGTYNIASGQPRTPAELLALMMELAGVEAAIQPESDPRRLDPPRLIGSASKLAAATGWRPVIPFAQSAREMLNDWLTRLSGAVRV